LYGEVVGGGGAPEKEIAKQISHPIKQHRLIYISQASKKPNSLSLATS